MSSTIWSDVNRHHIATNDRVNVFAKKDFQMPIMNVVFNVMIAKKLDYVVHNVLPQIIG